MRRHNRTLPLHGLGAALLALMTWGSLAGPANAAPNVVISIKPVYSLARMVMGDVATPTLLVQGNASPHTYSLRPSDAAALSGADLVVLVDRHSLELFLDKPLDSLAGNARVLSLADVPDTTHLPLREGGLFEAHSDDEADAAHEEAHAHEGEASDAHIWLDPDNGALWVEAIAAELSAIDPDHAAVYADNARRAIIAIENLKDLIAARLKPVQGKPFIVFHDAYHYFENRFGIAAIGSITVNPDATPGAARISEIHQKLHEAGAVCVFSEPQFPPHIVATVTEGTGARTGVLDPLGADLPDGPDLYPTLLSNLADALLACLGAD